MSTNQDTSSLRGRSAPLEINPEQFRALGHALVDQIAAFLESLPDRPVSTAETPSRIRTLLPSDPLPQGGTNPGILLEETAELLFDHSLFNGHPRFWGYITSSAAPLGALADLLAASVNPNVGAWALSPVASEIEAQTVRWIADLLGYPPSSGGLLVSGGNVANFVAFLAARHDRAPWEARSAGLADGPRLRAYCSAETHTWMQKAADFFGLGTDSIRWIPTDRAQRIDLTALETQIAADRQAGDYPFLVVGTAGSVSTGAVDPLPALAALCRDQDLWFHVDGAYGGFAAALPNASPDLKGIRLADSIAIDPHKWLYSPLEAGCTLVRDPQTLTAAFSYHPPYYEFDQLGGEVPVNFVDYGLQNSRGFRALKVWLSLRQAGRQGTVQMIADDIRLARALNALVNDHPELEACTQDLSITTFRYLPTGIESRTEESETYLNRLNTEILTRIQEGGEAYLSNAVVDGRYVLRACVVNFRTTLEDIEALPELVARVGRATDAQLRPEGA